VQDTGAVPVSIAVAERRVVGVPTPLLVLVLAAAAVALIVVFLIFGEWTVVLALVAVAVVLLVLPAAVVRREPSTATAQMSTAATDRAASWAGFARGSLMAWGDAARQVVQLRRELSHLCREREQALIELGAAAYAADDVQVEVLRAGLQTMDCRIAKTEQRLAGAVGEARRRVRREHAVIQPTERLDPAELESAQLAEHASPAEGPEQGEVD
jgi:hypothetical protein